MELSGGGTAATPTLLASSTRAASAQARAGAGSADTGRAMLSTWGDVVCCGGAADGWGQREHRRLGRLNVVMNTISANTIMNNDSLWNNINLPFLSCSTATTTTLGEAKASAKFEARTTPAAQQTQTPTNHKQTTTKQKRNQNAPSKIGDGIIM
jgi:hypothetical protein